MSDYPEPDEQELEAAMQLHRRQISTETIKQGSSHLFLRYLF